MPFTLVAWNENFTAAATLDALTAAADPHVRVSGDDVWIPEALPMLAGYKVLGSTVTQARIESPTLRTLTPIDVSPLDTATEPTGRGLSVLQPNNPKAVGGGEALNVKCSVSAAGRAIGLAWLCDGPLAAITGEIFTVRATSSTTLTANAWTNGALTFAQSLPKGRYAVVGMRAISAGLVAARLVFPGYAWRPGCIGYDAENDTEDNEFRGGRMGSWGEFDHDVPPTVDFLSISADTSEVVYLDLIKIA
jgi:hypothetical protein